MKPKRRKDGRSEQALSQLKAKEELIQEIERANEKMKQEKQEEIVKISEKYQEMAKVNEEIMKRNEELEKITKDFKERRNMKEVSVRDERETGIGQKEAAIVQKEAAIVQKEKELESKMVLVESATVSLKKRIEFLEQSLKESQEENTSLREAFKGKEEEWLEGERELARIRDQTLAGFVKLKEEIEILRHFNGELAGQNHFLQEKLREVSERQEKCQFEDKNEGKNHPKNEKNDSRSMRSNDAVQVRNDGSLVQGNLEENGEIHRNGANGPIEKLGGPDGDPGIGSSHNEAHEETFHSFERETGRELSQIDEEDTREEIMQITEEFRRQKANLVGHIQLLESQNEQLRERIILLNDKLKMSFQETQTLKEKFQAEVVAFKEKWEETQTELSKAKEGALEKERELTETRDKLKKKEEEMAQVSERIQNDQAAQSQKDEKEFHNVEAGSNPKEQFIWLENQELKRQISECNEIIEDQSDKMKRLQEALRKKKGEDETKKMENEISGLNVNSLDFHPKRNFLSLD